MSSTFRDDSGQFHHTYMFQSEKVKRDWLNTLRCAKLQMSKWKIKLIWGMWCYMCVCGGGGGQCNLLHKEIYVDAVTVSFKLPLMIISEPIRGWGWGNPWSSPPSWIIYYFRRNLLGPSEIGINLSLQLLTIHQHQGRCSAPICSYVGPHNVFVHS